MQGLDGRWAADARATLPAADGQATTALGRELLERWSEPHRRYHDTVHLGEVLSAVDTLCRAGKVAPDARGVALLGAWFHDVVHTAGARSDDERRSADLAEDRLRGIGAPPPLVAAVVTVVLDTEDHDLDDGASPGPGSRVPAAARDVLHDADLWILASPTPRFDEYCRQVRDEYRQVPAADYARGRSAVLRPFLVRDSVYRTAHARTAWEPEARENLARELSRLAG